MKTKHIILTLLAGLLAACQPGEKQVYDFEYTVDKVVCQANSNYFVADGVSQLGLEVKLYAIMGTYTDVNGQQQPSYIEIPKARWRTHDIKFFDRSGKEYTPDFTSTTLEPGVMEFYATVDGMRSSKPILQLLAEHPMSGEPIAEEQGEVFFKMNARAAEPVPAVKRYPVIFHIVDTEQAKNGMQEINSDAVYYVIDLYNSVFGRKTTHASNGANPNIEFVPALRDPYGALLKEPGINRVYLREGEEFETAMPFQRPSEMYWDYDKYLNIWIVSESSWTATSEKNIYIRSLPFVFAEGDYDPEKLPLPASVTVTEKNEEKLAEWKQRTTNLENVGLVFHKTRDAFANLGPAYVSQMSAFLGVIPNSRINDTGVHFGDPERWVDDYCDDTFQYNPYYGSERDGAIEGTNFGNSRTKYTAVLNEEGTKGVPGYPWIIYKSYNTGEQSSFTSVITQDQARRIEYTLNHAVARQAWRNSYAIDPVEK